MSGVCDFELDTCSWSNSRNDTFDWERTKGATATTATGPSADHTFQNSSGKHDFYPQVWCLTFQTKFEGGSMWGSMVG